ncbi:hypothetical protein LOTGIDRAFT_118892 [Lottia gigantea]|uniref:trans-L-3-hydroxyproline dehydratase n=1 Tax=Lottia gigantea TaxID=225164 RepID=V4AKP5_LOTGI|nr:hypothetical protein LOTGIDRAFT_118892 [Lottia gigantea]ESO94141.1 hypothetical protein LOTGIDRAFT_118892 [Lottia gigantea]
MEGKHETVSIKTVEMHTGGEPLRILLSGYPQPQGNTILEKRRNLQEKHDEYRKLAMCEPRGHGDMYGALLVPPTVPEANMAVLFMHNSGYSTMCGHGVIALGRYAIDNGYVKNVITPETEVTIQCPCGPVTCYVQYDGRKSGSVRFISVPAFTFATDVKLKTVKYGTVTVDIAYGGAFYIFLSAQSLGLDVTLSQLKDLVEAGGDITEAGRNQVKIDFPGNEDRCAMYLLTMVNSIQSISLSNIFYPYLFTKKGVDRSPCGSAVTARMALQHHKNQVKVGESRVYQNSKTSSKFSGKIVKQVLVDTKESVQVEVSGRGYYSGTMCLTVESDDDLGHGFVMG